MKNWKVYKHHSLFKPSLDNFTDKLDDLIIELKSIRDLIFEDVSGSNINIKLEEINTVLFDFIILWKLQSYGLLGEQNYLINRLREINSNNSETNNYSDFIRLLTNKLSHEDSLSDETDHNLNKINYLNIDFFNYGSLNITIKDEFIFNPTDNKNNYGIINIFQQFNEQIVQISGFDLTRIYNALIDKNYRQKHGSYFTDEGLTKFMVKEALKIYLTNKLTRKVVKGFLNDLDTSVNIDYLHIQKFIKELKSIKILDPAVGTGNFLFSVIQVLWDMHNKIRILLQKYNNRTLQQEIPDNVTDFEIYKTKDNDDFLGQIIITQIIPENIFGFDINSLAVKIVKMGILFLMLELPNQNNPSAIHSIASFPNIAVNDTLVFDFQTNNSSWPKKYNLILGNPPYLSNTDITNYHGYQYKAILASKFQLGELSLDYSMYFILKSISILEKQGVNSFIITNKWLRSKYGAPIRNYLAKNTQIKRIYNLHHIDFFKNIKVDTMIYSIIKNKPENNELMYFEPKKLSDFEEFTIFNQELLSDHKWTFLSREQLEMKQIIEQAGRPINEMGINIYRGITTGANKIFIINSEIRDKLISADSKSKELIKPTISGSEISPYYINWSNRWLIFTRRGINIDKYPAIKNYLHKHKSKLMPKPDDYDTEENRNWFGRKSGKYEWFEIQDTTSYYKVFENPKIISNKAAKTPSYSLDYSGIYSLNTCYILTTDKPYILAILNSKIARFYLNIEFSRLGENYEPKKSELVTLPIIVVEKRIEKIISNIVFMLIYLLQSGNSGHQIDEIIKFFRHNIIFPILFTIYFESILLENNELEDGFSEFTSEIINILTNYNGVLSEIKSQIQQKESITNESLKNRKIKLLDSIAELYKTIKKSKTMNILNRLISNHPYYKRLQSY